MFRSISRVTVAVAFVLALVLSTVPVQAQPRDFGSFATVEDSWLEMAMSWVESLLGGGSDSLQTLETSGVSTRPTRPGGNVGTMSGSCIDPYGNPCGDNG